MSYTALYRKFRPVEFEDVKGQEHIITTLKNQIEANRIGHAYLFCGTRGTSIHRMLTVDCLCKNLRNRCLTGPSCSAEQIGMSDPVCFNLIF